MKTKSIKVSLLFIFCCHLYGQKNDLKRLSLNGNVKTIRELNYKPLEKNGEVQKGNLEFWYHNTFNNQGNKIEDTRYTPDGKIDKKYEYKYDSTGKRIEQDQYTSDGKLIRKITYTYDNKGNITEDNSFSSEGKFEKKYTYTYDTTGDITEDNSFGPDNKLLKRFTYKYNDTGYKTENYRYNSLGILDKTVFYKYDIKSNVIEETSISPDGTAMKYVYLYSYDNKDNWIKKIKFNGKTPESIIEREIEYY